MEGKRDSPEKLRKRKKSLLSSDEESSPRGLLRVDSIEKSLNQDPEGSENFSPTSKKPSPRAGSIKITGGSSPRIGSSARSSPREKSPRPRKVSESKTGEEKISEEGILSISERIAQGHRKSTRRSQSANCAIQEKSQKIGDNISEQKRSTTNPEIICEPSCLHEGSSNAIYILPYCSKISSTENRHIPSLKSEHCLYVSVVKCLDNKTLNIESVNYNTMHLVESGYFGIEVSDETHRYIVYSQEKFKIKSSSSTDRFSTEKVPLAHHVCVEGNDNCRDDDCETKIIELFNDHFPIIIKLKTCARDDFKSIFLTIMFSIRKHL
jgi:hypothetical protein